MSKLIVTLAPVEACPDCGSKLHIARNKNGEKFVGCLGFHEAHQCRFGGPWDPALQKFLTTYKEKQQGLLDKVASLDLELRKAEAKIDDLKDDVASLIVESQEAEARIDSLTSNCIELSGMVADKDDEIAALKKRAAVFDRSEEVWCSRVTLLEQELEKRPQAPALPAIKESKTRGIPSHLKKQVVEEYLKVYKKTHQADFLSWLDKNLGVKITDRTLRQWVTQAGYGLTREQVAE